MLRLIAPVDEIMALFLLFRERKKVQVKMEQSQRLKVLWVTPRWLFPATDGARIASTQLLRHLKGQPVDIHLCAIVQKDEVIDPELVLSDLGIQNLSFVWRKKNDFQQKIRHFLRTPFFPITFAPYATKEVVDQMDVLFNGRKYDLIVYDGLHAAAWRAFSLKEKEWASQVVYRAHNVENELWFQAAREVFNPLKKALLFSQGQLVKKVEAALTRETNFLFPVSMNDEAKFRAYEPRGEVRTLPIGIQISTDRDTSHSEHSRARRLLFVGRLDWPPNKDGLAWGLKNVWLKAREKNHDLELTIVGSGDSSWLNDYKSYPGIKVEGAVKNLAPYYDNCLATLVPVFYGSGTRVKAIESSLYGRPCISTGIGVEGMGLVPEEHYYHAETVDDWVRVISTLSPYEAWEMGKRARAHAKQIFNPEVIATQFVDSVSGRKEAR